MSDFKNQIEKDLQTFINFNEFGEEHVIEGKKIIIVLDDDKLIERQSGAELGITGSTLLFYAKTKDLPKKKAFGLSLMVDGREYLVDSWTETAGIAQVVLSKNF